jgi:hypothetical protein
MLEDDLISWYRARIHRTHLTRPLKEGSRRLLCEGLFLWAVAFCSGHFTFAQASNMDTLVSNKEYAQLERALPSTTMSKVDEAYFSGLLANHLNRPADSIKLLESILPTLEADNPLRAEYAVCTLADDLVKLSLYGKAADTYTLAARIADSQARSSLCHADREAARWALFTEAPAQGVVSGMATVVRGTKDKLGLIELPVSGGNYSGAWLLDTGANLTVIRRSVAARMGLQLSATAESAAGISGRMVAVHSAVIPEFRIGSVVLRNVPVLVVEDSDLTFPELDYEIDGSLGLPVLAAFGKMTMYADASVKLGRGTGEKMRSSASHNLFLDGFTPLIAADLGEGDDLFVIDTGAQATILSSKFFAQSKDMAWGNLVTFDLAGAGGVGTMAAFTAENLVANFGGYCTALGDAHLLLADTESDGDFYGIIGQSAFRNFSSITLDFQNMQFSVAGSNGSCASTSKPAPAR